MSFSPMVQKAFALFDAANAEDPNSEVFEGVSHPKELLYAQRMTAVLNQFEPDASEALQLTVRCQHIGRWEIPREAYEQNRIGYLKWRQDLKSFHALKAREILEEIGYDSDKIDRVCFLLLKKQLKRDRETQILEDVICLVFLKYYYDAFLIKHDDNKIISILRKTWHKMSEKGQKSALAINFSERGEELIRRALS